MKPYIAAQFSNYGIAEAVSHSAVRPADDRCMSRTFVSGKAGENFHVTVGWYVWEMHPELSLADEETLAKSTDAEIEILDGPAVFARVTACTQGMLRFVEDGWMEYTASRMVIEGEEESLRAVLVFYRAGDAAVESLPDEALWELDVTFFDNDTGYGRENFLRFRGVR